MIGSAKVTAVTLPASTALRKSEKAREGGVGVAGKEDAPVTALKQECGGDEHDTRSPEAREIQQEVPFRKATRRAQALRLAPLAARLT